MERASLDGVELEYEISGSGDPVVLVHHGAGADWFAPLCREPALGSYRLVRYHRAGYAGSSRLLPPLTFEREAAGFRALMEYLGLERAHVVGHSLALLEPALLAVPSPPEVPRAIELYRAGDTVSAVDTFLRGTCGTEYREVLERVVPNAIEQALADSPTFFEHELPALRQWSFGPEPAGRVTQPALAVIGERTDSRFRQRQVLLLDWLPDVEEFVLPGAGHLLHLQNAAGMAAGLADFFARHSIGTAV